MRRLAIVVASSAALFCSATVISAAPIIEIEPNTTLATAQLVPSSAFTLPVPTTVFNLPGFPTATVTGTVGDVEVDFYAFSAAGGSAYFDIDDDPFTVDTVLSLFNASGTLIAYGDDTASFAEAATPGALDPGTTDRADSFIGLFTLPGPGTYYLAVSQFGRIPATVLTSTLSSLTRPDGFVSAFHNFAVSNAPIGDSSFVGTGGAPGIYTLHLSVQNPTNGTPTTPTPVPEPLALLLFGAGLSAAVVRLRRH